MHDSYKLWFLAQVSNMWLLDLFLERSDKDRRDRLHISKLLFFLPVIILAKPILWQRLLFKEMYLY